MGERTLTPLPFDASISVYLGVSAEWRNLENGVTQTMECRCRIQAFQPDQTPTEEGVDQQPLVEWEVPTGWEFVDPVGDQVMLVVVVRDQQGRLGRVTIEDLNQQTPLGELAANAEGTEVNGEVAVPSATLYYSLTIHSKQGFILGKLGGRRPGEVKYYLALLGGGFTPNHPPRAEGVPTCFGHAEAPPGDPEDITNKTAGAGGIRTIIGDMTKPREDNDTAQETQVMPPRVFCKRKKLRDDVDPRIESRAVNAGDVLPALRTEDNAKIPLTDVGNVPPEQRKGLWMPPFSRAAARWCLVFDGIATGVVAVPQHKAKENWWNVLLAGAAAGLIAESRSMAVAVAAALNELLKQRDKQEATGLRPGDVIAAGDIWVLGASELGKSLVQVQNITAPVTFELWADLLPPAPGQAGLVGGTGIATVVEPWTNPPPPGAMPQDAALNFPDDGPDKGRVTVNLGKGWKWTATGRPNMMPYSQGNVGPFRVPTTVPQRINSNLQMLLTLKVKTVSAHGNEPCRVELERKMPDNSWAIQGSGDTTTQANGEEIWSTGPLNPGTYRVRAQSRLGMMSPWSNWEEFGVQIGIEVTRSVTVTRQGMPNPPR